MTNYRRRRRVLSQKPSKTRAAHAQRLERTPWRRPLRVNGKPFAHRAARWATHRGTATPAAT